jgi:ABC-type transport system involved in multi-copper enzyme maturation permease subunit
MEETRKISRLLLIAIIWALFFLVCIIAYLINNRLNPFDGTEGYLRYYYISVLLALTLPTLLTAIVRNKNNKVMILVAGILYIFGIITIPSAILCFVAFAKMIKSEA